MAGGALTGNGGGIEPTVAYIPLSLDWLLYDNVGEVAPIDLPLSFDRCVFDDEVVFKRNTFDNEVCYGNQTVKIKN